MVTDDGDAGTEAGTTPPPAPTPPVGLAGAGAGAALSAGASHAAPGGVDAVPGDPHLADPDLAEAFRYGVTSPAAITLERTPTGPALAARLAAVNLADVDDATVIEVIAGYEREIARLVSTQAMAVAELQARRDRTHGRGTDANRLAVSEVQARLGITQHAAEAKVNLALGLQEFPAVAHALTAGRIDARKADILLTHDSLTPAERRRLHAQLLAAAGGLTGPQLKAQIATAALRVDPDAGKKRRAQAVRDRTVSFDDGGDGMMWVAAFIRADHGAAARVVLEALAAASKTDTDNRTVDQRRADAFADIFGGILERGVDLQGQPLPTFHGQRALVQVTIGAGTLLGIDDEPAVLGGHGPISAELGREIALDGTWRGLFTDAAGCFAALGSKKYRPGADLSRTVIARDVTCSFPGCRQPAWRADLDHIDSYDPAVADLLEQTTKNRMQALCRRHHNLKTAKFWHASRDEVSGAITWTAPTGHVYIRAPDRPPGPPPPPARAPAANGPQPPGIRFRGDGSDVGDAPPF